MKTQNNTPTSGSQSKSNNSQNDVAQSNRVQSSDSRTAKNFPTNPQQPKSAYAAGGAKGDDDLMSSNVNSSNGAKGMTSSSPKAFGNERQPGVENEGQSQDTNKSLPEINKQTERGAAPETATGFTDDNKNNAA